MLVLHDTTEFIYRREDSHAIGIIHKLQTRYDRPLYHTTSGVLMHSSLVVTQEGLPLGLAAIKFWTRNKFHGANALKRRINPTRVRIEQKESYRWLENMKQSTALLASPERLVHIGDRESDIMSCSQSLTMPELTSSLEPASIGSRAKATIPLPTKCAGSSPGTAPHRSARQER